jgi:hypothetical protein
VKAELLLELLRSWEEHTGPSSELVRALGMKRTQLARLIAEARRAAASTNAVDPAFLELPAQGQSEPVPVGSCIELAWGADKVIRFPSVDTLMDFLKKAS